MCGSSVVSERLTSGQGLASNEGPRVASSIVRAPARSRVLFVTPELGDFVKVGGLGEVSAALPRALLPSCDVRVLVPGYRQVLARCGTLHIVGRCEAFAALPSCDIGRLETPDGLTVYVVVCPELYDRDGTPYGDAEKRDWHDNDLRFARLSLAAAGWRAAK